MTKRVGLVTLVMVLMATSMVNAGITSWNCDDDGDGVITMQSNPSQFTDNGNADYTLRFPCTQDVFAAGHVEGEFVAPSDPSVYLIEDVTNDTGYAWTGYEFYIGMNNSTFAINPSFIMAPAGWTYVINPVAPGTLPNNNGSGYVGSVIFSQGTGNPIADGETGTFGVKFSFVGTTQFCTEQVPTPEPVTLTLLAMGGLAMLYRRR